jgi:hypothetical protein
MKIWAKACHPDLAGCIWCFVNIVITKGIEKETKLEKQRQEAMQSIMYVLEILYV